MSSSTGSGGVVDECARWSAEAVVEADRGGEGEEAAAEAGAEAVQGAGAVAFEGEEVFAGLEDRLDPLPDLRERRRGSGFVSSLRADDRRSLLADGLFELAAGVAFVADDRERLVAVEACEQLETHLSLGRLGRGELERARGAVEREQAVQAEAPEVAAVGGAVAVVGGVGELAAPGCLDRAGALDRRRVDQDEVVVIAGAVAGEDGDQRLDRVREPLASLV